MSGSDINYLTATRIKQMLATRKISAIELLDLHLHRVKTPQFDLQRGRRPRRGGCTEGRPGRG